MTRFVPPDGRPPRWAVALDLLRATEVGACLHYDALADALDVDPVDRRHVIQAAVRKAARRLRSQDLRAIESVPNKGYRVVEPGEQLRLARDRQRRAALQLKDGHSLVTDVNLGGMAPDIRHAFELTAAAFRMQRDMLTRVDIRQRRLEEALASVSAQQASDAEELRARLAEAEAAIAQLREQKKPGAA